MQGMHRKVHGTMQRTSLRILTNRLIAAMTSRTVRKSWISSSFLLIPLQMPINREYTAISIAPSRMWAIQGHSGIQTIPVWTGHLQNFRAVPEWHIRVCWLRAYVWRGHRVLFNYWYFSLIVAYVFVLHFMLRHAITLNTLCFSTTRFPFLFLPEIKQSTLSHNSFIEYIPSSLNYWSHPLEPLIDLPYSTPYPVANVLEFDFTDYLSKVDPDLLFTANNLQTSSHGWSWLWDV